jgi:hypothetical protein
MSKKNTRDMRVGPSARRKLASTGPKRRTWGGWDSSKVKKG